MQLGTTAALVAAALAVLLVAVCAFFSRRFSYWRRRGVPYLQPVPLLGNLNHAMGKKGFAGLVEAMEPFREEGVCGVYLFGMPALAVWDLEMVKQIGCKDFSSFHDRFVPFDEADPLSAHLFNLRGARWRNLRRKMSPAFTSGKMKRMLPLMSEVADELRSVLAEEAAKKDDGEVDVLLLLHRFATDVIGSCAFGMSCNCLREENNEFFAMSRNLLRQSFGQLVRMVLGFISTRLASLVPMKFLYPAEHRFFLNLMSDTVEFREKNKVERNDFVDLMMQLRDAGLNQDDPENHVELTSNMMAAQAFIFFVAGLDNISNTMGFCLNRLAADPELQSAVRDEVEAVMRRHGGDMSYEALKEMQLVNGVLLEGLRLWNPIGMVFRRCNATTRVGSVVVEEGTAVLIPAPMLHLDPALYPQPRAFDPRRYMGDHDPRADSSFLPFGLGPRVCIAERFAMMELRLCLAALLRGFEFGRGPRFEEVIELDTKHPLPTPKNGCRLRVSPRAHSHCN